MSAHVQPNELSAKSLFTAVLYSDVPESSASSSTGERSIYLKQIRREHLARASMKEVGSQLPDATDPESITKVAQLTERAKRAYSEVNGNSADGRWSFLSDLLRLHCTRGGRHWIGTNTGVGAPVVSEHLCILPRRSHEWKQLERKRKEEEDVKSRVQRWITTAEFDPLTPEKTVVLESTVNEQIPFTQASLSVSQRPIHTKQMTLKSAFEQANSTNKFGFPVVRRSHVVGKAKGDVGGFRRSSSPRLRSQHSDAGDNKLRSETSQQSHQSPAHSIGPSSAPNAERVSNSQKFQPLHAHKESEAPAGFDVLASSTPPPSFPTSQIQTSTPRRGPALEEQNQPTISFEHPPSPSADVVEIPRPTVDDSHFSEPFHLPDGHSRKRVRSPSPGEQEPVLKRARISQEADHFLSPPELRPNVEEIPLTPPNRNLPRLTDLIAKCQKLSPRKKSSSSRPPIPAENATEITAVAEPSIHHQDDPRRMETTIAPIPSIDAVHQPSIQGSCFEQEPSPPMAEVNAVDARVEAEATSALEIVSLCPEHMPEHLLKDRRMNVGSERHLLFPGQLAPQPDARPTEKGALAVPESRPQTPDPLKSPISDAFRFPSAEPGSSQANLAAAPYNLYGLDNLDNPSPAKSLSSLAGSDSGSGSDEEDGGHTTAGNITVPQEFFAGHEFNPPFTSTQKPGLDSVRSAIGGVLSSDFLGEKLPPTSQLQAEINSQVDEFDKFMEADLGCDPVAL